MSGITNILDIAARSLLAEQLGIEVTAHNVANVNTPGYSRQRVDYATAITVPSPYGPMGSGVKVQGIERSFDPFITARLDEKSSLLADYQTRASALELVAAFFNETQEAGLNDLLSDFWAAWQDLANNPSGYGERQALVFQALTLCDAFNFKADQLVQERLKLLQQVGPALQEINQHAANIAKLNREIVEMEANGRTANDLRDQRQLEISKMSQLIGIRTFATGESTINVTLTNGLPLVEGVSSWRLTYELSPTGFVDLIWQGPGGTEEHLDPSTLAGGKLAALLKVRDVLIPQYQQELDQMASEFIFLVNSQHTLGVGLTFFSEITGSYAVNDVAAPLGSAGLPFGDRIVSGSFQIFVDRDGAPLTSGSIAVNPSLSLNDLVAAINSAPGLAGYVTASVENNCLKIVANSPSDTFAFAQDTSQVLAALGVNTFFTGDKAYTFKVNTLVLNQPQFIAAGQIDASGAHAVGDNRNALALAALENAPTGSEGLTIAERYQQLVMTLGLEAQQADSQKNFFQGLVEQLTQMRDAVSGVSLDEELTNLVKFQRAYQAAARLVSVADELYQTLLAIKK